MCMMLHIGTIHVYMYQLELVYMQETLLQRGLVYLNDMHVHGLNAQNMHTMYMYSDYVL